MTAPRRIGVFGVGNVLMSDDGIGPHVLKTLEAHCCFPPHVVLHDLGAPGPDLTLFLARYDAVILIHTVNAGRPGEIQVYRKRQLLGVPKASSVIPNDPAVLNALLCAESAGKSPQELLLVGVVPESTGVGCGLSESVRTAVAGAVSVILAELYRLGTCVRARSEAEEPSHRHEEKVSSECQL